MLDDRGTGRGEVAVDDAMDDTTISARAAGPPAKPPLMPAPKLWTSVPYGREVAVPSQLFGEVCG